MSRTSSILWILFLLAAMAIGPAVILRRSRPDLKSLRDAAAQEHLLDAPRETR